MRRRASSRDHLPLIAWMLQTRVLIVSRKSAASAPKNHHVCHGLLDAVFSTHWNRMSSFMDPKISRCAGIIYEPTKKRQTSAKSVQTVVLSERKKFFMVILVTTETRRHGVITPVFLF